MEKLANDFRFQNVVPTIVPAQPGWLVVWPSGNGGTERITAVDHSDVVAWQVRPCIRIHGGKDFSLIQNAEVKPVCLDDLPGEYAVRSPSGRYTLCDDCEVFNSEVDLIAFWEAHRKAS